MAKSSSVFICQNCGYESPKWAGQCPSCSAWNTFEETISQRLEARGKRLGKSIQTAQVLRFSDVKHYDKEILRLPTGMEEFDRVLGGGIVFGSVILIGGEPGIGKSTILTQLTINVLNKSVKRKGEREKENEQNSTSTRVLYIAGEESPEQIALRIQRMSADPKNSKFQNPNTKWKDSLLFLTSTDVDEITATIEAEKPTLVIVDSIQTLSTQDLTGATGSIGQLKECTERLTRTAKALHVPVFLVGHVTKEGAIAGPKVLEHVVDAVLELTGERTGAYRLLRAIKNRFGATDEVGVFEVIENGLREITNPSEVFLDERLEGAIGSAIVCVMEGTRPLLIEVQALVVRSQLPIPRRVARGVSLQKLQLLTAVLEKYAKLPLGTCDVFVNIAGGMMISDPGVDLGLLLAVAASYLGQALPSSLVCVGEVGLLGEIRRVKLLEKREKEAKRLGRKSFIGPFQVKTVKAALDTLFPG